MRRHLSIAITAVLAGGGMLVSLPAAQAAVKVIYPGSDRPAMATGSTNQRSNGVGGEYDLSVDLTNTTINHIGPMPESLPASFSEGHDAPLVSAFNGIVPVNWQVYVHERLNDKRPVSWTNDGDNWVRALYQIGARYDYVYDINWNRRWILVNKRGMREKFNYGDNPEIEVVGGSGVSPGKVGHMAIDGRLIKVRSTNR